MAEKKFIDTEVTLPRSEAADLVRIVADQLAEGGDIKLVVGGETVAVPGPTATLEVEVELEREHGMYELELELEWADPTAGDAIETEVYEE